VPGYRHTKQRSTRSALSVLLGRNRGVDGRTRQQNTRECDEGLGENETHLEEPA
jgi:hypothetical protein